MENKFIPNYYNPLTALHKPETCRKTAKATSSVPETEDRVYTQ